MDIHTSMMAVIHLLVVFMYMLPNGYVLGLDCGDNALGMQKNVIPDDKITASSGTAGDQARLNYTSGPSWCAMGNDTNPYLQIDLGTPHIICAVSTQGDHQVEQWVRVLKLNYSHDGKAYYSYRENGNTQQTFYGNVDNSGIVKQILYQGITARYLRILPMMHHGAACMRAEIYGIQIQSENLALNKTAKQFSTTHDGNASRAVDGNRDGNWLGGSCTHCNRRYYFAWWRVDLGISVEVEEVSVFTRTHPRWGLRLWNTTFELRIGHDVTRQKSNPRCGGQYGIIPAGSITIVCNPTRNGRYVTITQKKEGQLSLCEVEIYGEANVAFRRPVTQSSHYGVLFGPIESAVDGFHSDTTSSRKCTSTDLNKPNPWWKVDLGQITPVDRIYVFTFYNELFDYLQIQIGNSTFASGTSKPLCVFQEIIRITKGIRMMCHETVQGRYVTISFTKNVPHGEELELCEVEVYAKALVCARKAIGISNNKDQVISDDKQITASSIYSNMRSAAKARLLGKSTWRPRDDDSNPWLQIDLEEIYYVCAVATQGDPNRDERTQTYKLKWTSDGVEWEFVKNKSSNTEQIFTGNRDKSSIIKHIFSTPLTVRKIRFYPVEKNIAYALRVELYGIKKQGPQTPYLIGKRILDPRYEAHVDLVCRAERGQSIKWYHNDTDITSYSIGTVRTGSILISTLRVKYTSDDDVYEKYSCDKAKRYCTSLDYICQVDYGSYRTFQVSGKVTVLLEVPNPPFIEIQNSSRSAARIMIIQPKRTADQGNGITKYSIELDEKKIADTSQTTYFLTGLKPYTKYTVRVMASSRIGNSEWSMPKAFTTQQAEPSAAPKYIIATKMEDGKFIIFWDEIPQEHANGEILTYEINWKPVNLERKRRAVVSTLKAKNATKSPHLLDGLSLHVTYNVSIRGYTTAGPGPFSVPITINKG